MTFILLAVRLLQAVCDITPIYNTHTHTHTHSHGSGVTEMPGRLDPQSQAVLGK